MASARTSPTPFNERRSSMLAVLMSMRFAAAAFGAGFGLVGFTAGAGAAFSGAAGDQAKGKNCVSPGLHSGSFHPKFGFFRTDGASARPTGTLGSLLCYIKAAAGKISQGGASGRIGFCLGNQERGLRKEGVSLLTDILQ